MKVRISDIPHTGLKVNDILPLDALNARMQLGDSKDIVFTEAPRVDLVVMHTQSGAETKGTVRTKFKQECSRCLENMERPLEIPANFILQPKPEAGAEPEDPDASYVDDVGISFFEGDHIDLEDLLQEALILSMTIYWSPPCDQKGNCTQCGINRSKFESYDDPPGNSLGKLFKKAGLN
ncbi:MAG: DUF177 domain-containing protein [Deltaproteobacteria bacterium]|nr:DUF177 domain-containing protein [Deltaproteobacteria bacterium]